MNISDRIRSLIISPKTAAEIHQKMPEVSLALIRGCIQTMVRVGLVNRIGSKKPYTYQVARSLKQQNRGFDLSKVSFSQQVRDQLKKKDMRPAEIADAIGSTSQKVFTSLRDSCTAGYVQKAADGTYKFVRDPVQKVAMSKEERYRRQREYRDRKAAEEGRTRNPRRPVKPYTVIEPKKVTWMGDYQTVEEWVAAGGVIDRSPTPNRFERLTDENILTNSFKS